MALIKRILLDRSQLQHVLVAVFPVSDFRHVLHMPGGVFSEYEGPAAFPLQLLVQEAPDGGIPVRRRGIIQQDFRFVRRSSPFSNKDAGRVVIAAREKNQIRPQTLRGEIGEPGADILQILFDKIGNKAVPEIRFDQIILFLIPEQAQKLNSARIRMVKSFFMTVSSCTE